MNKYNKLLLDEIQAIANLLAKHIDNANLSFDSRINITKCLEATIDNLDEADAIFKNALNNDFNN